MKAIRKSDGQMIEVEPAVYGMKSDIPYHKCISDGRHYPASDLDFNVPDKNKETGQTVDRWLTRSKNGELILSDSPECKRGNTVWYHKEGADVIALANLGLFDSDIFPNVTWESDPFPVSITINAKIK